MILTIIHLIISIVITALLIVTIRYYIKTKKTIENVRSRVNHDLRSPLNAILGFSDLLLQTEKDQEKVKFLSAIKSGGISLLALIEELSSKLAAGNDLTKGSPYKPTSNGSELKSNNNLENDLEPLILVVDDMIENVVFLEKILAKSGLRTVSAMSGEDALDVMTEHKPDLILLDIVMPGMSGFDTCAKIQSNKDFLVFQDLNF